MQRSLLTYNELNWKTSKIPLINFQSISSIDIVVLQCNASLKINRFETALMAAVMSFRKRITLQLHFHWKLKVFIGARSLLSHQYLIINTMIILCLWYFIHLDIIFSFICNFRGTLPECNLSLLGQIQFRVWHGLCNKAAFYEITSMRGQPYHLLHSSCNVFWWSSFELNKHKLCSLG